MWCFICGYGSQVCKMEKCPQCKSKTITDKDQTGRSAKQKAKVKNGK